LVSGNIVLFVTFIQAEFLPHRYLGKISTRHFLHFFLSAKNSHTRAHTSIHTQRFKCIQQRMTTVIMEGIFVA